MNENNNTSKSKVAHSFWQSIKMIAWAFFGIRKKSDSQEDTARINPFHIIVVGLVGVILLVAALIFFVGWVVP